MNILTKDYLIKTAANRWFTQYKREIANGDSKRIKTCSELRRATTTDQIDHITGNTSWTSLKCEQCGLEVKAVALVQPTRNHHTYYICRSCLEKYLKAFDKVEK